ncbi:MAG: HAMP domain-containing sensor histidine kinase [Desulfomicrobium sp.]|nr:HAMP domain-containing sensor histidine kinase [Desulfomicrobium sp.]NLV97387.1 HAMP domain-containing histidine kinase [Desulfovibrionales bacterium]
MQHKYCHFRTPLLVMTAMTLALGLWIFWSWLGYVERATQWRLQRAQDSFETLNAVIATLSNGELTDWKQIESVLSSTIRNSRTTFVVVQGRYGRLAQVGAPPDFLATDTTRGQITTENMLIFWAPLQPINPPTTWAEALIIPTPGRGLWPKTNPVMYLGFRAPQENFWSSWFWQRQASIFVAALVCILAMTFVWIALIRRRTLTAQLAAERLRTAHLEELGLAAAGLAHETKNPLGIIMGIAQQISQRDDIPKDTKLMLEYIMDEVDTASSRLGNFMSFAKPYSPQLAPVDIANLGQEVAEILGPEFEAHNVTLNFQVPTIKVWADWSMLRQILVNLLLNSLHASKPNTRVEVLLQNKKAGLRLLIIDQGSGIAPDLLPDIFKPYTTGSPSGHGLGLAIVRRLVEAHHWQIRATSSPQGTTMTISEIKPAWENI